MSEFTNEEILLSGLGKGMPGMMKRVPKLDIGSSTVRKHLIERIHKFPKDIQRALLNGTAETMDSPYYSVTQANGTRVELIKTSQPEQKGITNIDNGKLGKDRHMVLSGIKLQFDDTNQFGYYTTPYSPELLNAEWEIQLNGKKVLEKMPIRKFFDGIFGYRTDLPFGYYPLENPKIIKPQTDVEFNIDGPFAITGYIRIELIGATVRKL